MASFPVIDQEFSTYQEERRATTTTHPRKPDLYNICCAENKTHVYSLYLKLTIMHRNVPYGVDRLYTTTTIQYTAKSY
jgi:hypothetical protein